MFKSYYGMRWLLFFVGAQQGGYSALLKSGHHLKHLRKGKLNWIYPPFLNQDLISREAEKEMTHQCTECGAIIPQGKIKDTWDICYKCFRLELAQRRNKKGLGELPNPFTNTENGKSG